MNRRDIELLSAYLDGELKSAENTRLESRLQTDPELVSALNDLRATRTLLRKLPSRKAPRNFTLTRKMVGLNPPLPRTYPAFRLATVVATLLFFFSFGINFMGTQMASPTNFGMGGGAPEVESYAAEAPAEEPAAPAPAASEPMDVAPTATGGPSVSMAPQATQLPPSEDATRIQETPSAKDGENQNSAGTAPLPAPQPEPHTPLIPYGWQIGLAVAAVVGALLTGFMRRFSSRRWK